MSGVEPRSVLLVGASRGLGLAMAAEFVARGWSVVATVRGAARTALHALRDEHPQRLAIETLDVVEPGEVAALRERLAGRSFDILFVNAGVTNEGDETIAEVATDEFVRVMVTNALAPLRVIESLDDLVAADGLIGVMSSGQGSVANNEKGGHELYRGSKAALNTFVRSYAARRSAEARALVLMAPGWTKTALGGADAPMTVDESMPKIVDVLLDKRHRPGLEYLDYRGRTVPW